MTLHTPFIRAVGRSEFGDDDTAEPVPVVRVAPSFDEFYSREYPKLVGLGYVLTGSASVAEDLVQHACTEAHRQWHKIGLYEKPGAWVRRVIVNKSTSRFRRLRSETKALTRIAGRRVDVVEPSERSLEVWAAVRRLPTRQAQAIALLYWEDMSIAGIAEVLGCSSETVKTHLKRGRATLGRDLSAFGGAT